MTTFRLAAPRQRPAAILVGVAMLAMALAAAAILVLAIGGLGGDAEGLAACLLAGSGVLLLLVAGTVRAHDRGVAVAELTTAGVTFRASPRTGVFMRYLAWPFLPGAVVALRWAVGATHPHTTILTMGLGACVLGVLVGLYHQVTYRPPAEAEPWVALGPRGITAKQQDHAPRFISWEHLDPATGPFPLRRCLSWPNTSLENTSASDPQVVALAIEHFRAHLGDRHLLTDPERTAYHLEALSGTRPGPADTRVSG